MEALARRILTRPIEIQVGGRSVICKDVEQQVIIVEDDQKFYKLLEILGHYQDKGSAIIFVNKQENANHIHVCHFTVVLTSVTEIPQY